MHRKMILYSSILLSFLLLSCSYNSFENMSFMKYHIIDKNNESVENAVVIIDDWFNNLNAISDSAGFAFSPFVSDTIEIEIFHPKYKNSNKKVIIDYQSIRNTNSNVTPYDIQIDLSIKKELFISVDSLKSEFSIDPIKNIEIFADISIMNLSYIDSLFATELLKLEKQSDNRTEKVKPYGARIITLQFNIKSLTELINYKAVNPLETILIEGSNSYIRYPILLNREKAVISIDGGFWWGSYLIELVDNNKLKVSVIREFIS